MRDVILYMSMSLDGFVGSDREHPGVAVPEGAELKHWKLESISRAGAHLMGRITYQEMSSYWPQSDDPYASPMNDTGPAAGPGPRTGPVRPTAGIKASGPRPDHAVPQRRRRPRLPTPALLRKGRPRRQAAGYFRSGRLSRRP